MFYYKYFDEKQNLIGVEQRSTKVFGEMPNIVEITENEYQEILEAIVSDVEPEPTDQISDSEALEIITGGVTE